MVPVLNNLLVLRPTLRVMLRTTVPKHFFDDRLRVPFSLTSVAMDVGCIQSSPVQVDVKETFARHDEFHATWSDRLAVEMEAISDFEPNVVFSGHSYLALEAGRLSNVPTALLVGFTWAQALAVYAKTPLQWKTVEFISDKYVSNTDLAIRMSPRPEIDMFSDNVDIEPIASLPALGNREKLADLIQAGDRFIGLIAFGGIEAEAKIDWDSVAMKLGSKYVFIVQSPLLESQVPSHLQSVFICGHGGAIESCFSFKELLASVDLVLSKPGYGTVLEMVALRKPLVYIRRGDFIDEQPILDYLHATTPACEISMNDFLDGEWESAFHKAQNAEIPKEIPRLNGASQAAEYLSSRFE